MVITLIGILHHAFRHAIFLMSPFMQIIAKNRHYPRVNAKKDHTQLPLYICISIVIPHRVVSFCLLMSSIMHRYARRTNISYPGKWCPHRIKCSPAVLSNIQCSSIQCSMGLGLTFCSPVVGHLVM